MLFVIYINDIDDIVNHVESSVTVKLFADDTKLYTIIFDEFSLFSAVKLQSCLDCIVGWLCSD